MYRPAIPHMTISHSLNIAFESIDHEKKIDERARIAFSENLPDSEIENRKGTSNGLVNCEI